MALSFIDLMLFLFGLPQQDEFLDVIYWSRQVLGIIIGIIWGTIPLQGFTAIAL